LEMLREAFIYARHHVGDETANEPVKRPMLVVVGRPLEDEVPVLLLHGDVARQGALELALRTLDLDLAGRERDLHLVRHRDRQLPYPRQLFLSLRYQT